MSSCRTGFTFLFTTVYSFNGVHELKVLDEKVNKKIKKKINPGFTH